MVSGQDHTDKIKKLLALAESDNENEAKAALLKAKELMAQHKISEQDLEAVKHETPVRDVTEFTCSKRRDPWMVALSAVVGENFCCQGFRTHRTGKQTQGIGFVGFPEDIHACEAVFSYAVDCIKSGQKRLKKKYKDYPELQRAALDGYAFGFARGIREAFELQKETDETGWGLVMTIPQEVRDMTASYGTADFHSRAQDYMSAKAYKKGRRDGLEFDPGTKLGTQENEGPEPDR